MEIRTYTGTDSEGMIDLWKCAGLVHPANDPHRDIDRKMSDSPWEFLVAVDNGEIGPAQLHVTSALTDSHESGVTSASIASAPLTSGSGGFTQRVGRW